MRAYRLEFPVQVGKNPYAPCSPLQPKNPLRPPHTAPLLYQNALQGLSTQVQAFLENAWVITMATCTSNSHPFNLCAIVDGWVPSLREGS